MPQCIVTVAVGKRAKDVPVEFAKGADHAPFETIGDWCAAQAMELEPNADRILVVGGLSATKAEAAAAAKAEAKVEGA
jgi:hypothetical protein